MYKENKKTVENDVIFSVKMPRSLRDESRQNAMKADVTLSQMVRKFLRDFNETQNKLNKIKQEDQG